MQNNLLRNLILTLVATLTVASCGDGVYLKEENPARIYKDYGIENKDNASVIGVGDPISKRRMHANATLNIAGYHSLEDAMRRVASTYNLAVRYGDGVRKDNGKELTVNELTFDEARNYIEDVFEVQIVREGERRLLVLPSIDEPRIEKFSPGTNVSLSQFIRGLARQCNYNLMVPENKKAISSTYVTATLEDITCRDAFESVLSPYGLALIDQGDHFSIGGFPTKRWVLNLYEPKRNETQNISYSSSATGGGDGATSTSGGSGSIDTVVDRDVWAELQKDLEDLIAKNCQELKDNLSTMTTGATDAATETVSSQISDDECGYVRINATVGLVQMRAPQAVLKQAEQVINRVEEIASRRLLVEARIIAVSKDHSYDKDGGISGNSDTNDRVFAQTGSKDSISTKISDFVGGTFGWRSDNLDAIVQFAETFGTTYQLMQPTMEVMDRQRAMMIDGRNEVYFIAETEEQAVDSGNGDTTKSYVDKYQFVGIQFSVVAQIAEPGEPHTLAIQVPITDIERFVPNPDSTVVSEIPVVSTRVIDQKVRIRDGEVKVIGGLTRRTAIDKDSGVPLLREAPVAGNLFDKEQITYKDLEFVVLLQVRRLY